MGRGGNEGEGIKGEGIVGEGGWVDGWMSGL